MIEQNKNFVQNRGGQNPEKLKTGFHITSELKDRK